MSEMIERAFKANQAKLAQLVKDAEAKVKQHEGDKQSRAYWMGVSFGLRRAMTVIEGRG